MQCDAMQRIVRQHSLGILLCCKGLLFFQTRPVQHQIMKIQKKNETKKKEKKKKFQAKTKKSYEKKGIKQRKKKWQCLA